MDGRRLQNYWSNEIKAMLETYRQFQVLIPSKEVEGSAHNAEDGRYVETLIREYLKKYLPRELEVLTGFILRPAVKTELDNRSRRNKEDTNSSQLDIIVYNSGRYPVFQRFGESVIVPPEGVIGIISVKKKLKTNHIIPEIESLRSASKLCHCSNQDTPLRGPFLALVSMESANIRPSTIFNKMESTHSNEYDYFDNLVGYIGSLNGWTIFKTRPPQGGNSARYIHFTHNDQEMHLGLQFILTGILSVFYDKSRSSTSRPGFTGFPSHRSQDTNLGTIDVKGLREGIE